MVKRILNLLPAELISLSKEDFLAAVAGSEGRVLAAETIGVTQPLLSDVTNAEFAAAMGADLLLLKSWPCPRRRRRTRCAGSRRSPAASSASIWSLWTTPWPLTMPILSGL